ncbi:MAG: ATP-binding protein, partial [Sulfitobacter sp.]
MTASALFHRVADSFLPDPPKFIGVAVSGGSDSLALLYLLHDFARDHHVALSAATVDHGLRPEAAAEANLVAEICAGLNVPHTVLPWIGWDARG